MALEEEKETGAIEALDRGLKILNLFAQEKRDLALTEISSMIGEHKSTVYRTLATLEARGFVERSQGSKKYWVGVRLFTLGGLYQSRVEIRRIARPLAEVLANRFEETVHLGILENRKLTEGKVIVLDKIDTPQPLKLSPSIGAEAAAHACGVGKALLAYQDIDVVERIACDGCLKAYTVNTITTLEALLKELETIRAQGYAIDEQELEMGLKCIAAPIFDNLGRAVAAISISGPSSRLCGERLPEMIEGVKETAMHITERLG